MYNLIAVPVAADAIYPARHARLSFVWSSLAMALSCISWFFIWNKYYFPFECRTIAQRRWFATLFFWGYTIAIHDSTAKILFLNSLPLKWIMLSGLIVVLVNSLERELSDLLPPLYAFQAPKFSSSISFIHSLLVRSPCVESFVLASYFFVLCNIYIL